MAKRYMITGLSESGCPLCIAPEDARARPKKPLVFTVAGEGGGFSGPCCPDHIAALIRLDEPERKVPPTALYPPKEVAKTVLVTGNGNP